jgi:diaminopimelate decarboxylase
MRKERYAYRVERAELQEEAKKSLQQILCGFTCMEEDRFFSLEAAPLSLNDRVVFEKVGAYTMGLSPQFIEAYPAVYATDNEKDYVLVREKKDLPTN